VLLLARELGHGGSERQLTEIAKRLDSARFAVNVGYFRPGVRSIELEEAGVPCFQLGVRSFRQADILQQSRDFATFLRNRRIQIVHTFDYPLTCFAVPIARLCGVPIVLSSQRGHRNLVPPHFRVLLRVTDLIVDGIVVNCVAMQDHLIQEEEWARRRIHLCYNGIDVQYFQPRRSLPEFIEAKSRLTVGCICVLRPEKQLDILLRAVAQLQTSLPNLCLVIVGSGPENENLQELARNLGILDKCRFQPAERDIRPWLAQIDIFVLPSSTEALSNSLMEAMATGCCVVASKVGGTPELVIDGETGLLFQSGNAIDLAHKLQLLAAKPTLRKVLAEKARQLIVDKFSLGRSASRLTDIYEYFMASIRHIPEK
jgi:glycosyltransferase involved in cell wall biosynthesis